MLTASDATNRRRVVLRFSERSQFGPLRPCRSQHGCVQFRRRQYLGGHDRYACIRIQPSTDNSCTYSAHVRFLLQQRGDDLSGMNGKQYFRWWSNSVAYEIAPGSANLSASLADLNQWTSVFGEKANANAAATAGFRQAMANLGNVDFSFGGGCYYGHGVRVSGGGARFAITSYAVK